MDNYRNYIQKLIAISKANINLYGGQSSSPPTEQEEELVNLSSNTYDGKTAEARNMDHTMLENRNHDQINSTIRLATIKGLTRQDYYRQAVRAERKYVAYLQLLLTQRELWNLRTQVPPKSQAPPDIDQVTCNVFTGEPD